MIKRLLFSLLGIFAICQVYGQADSVTLITDRPTQSASAYTIAKGSFQIETGFAYSNYKGPVFFTGAPQIRVEDITLNTTLVRYGITNGIELNFGQSVTSSRFFVDDVQQGETLTDLFPTTLGLRFQLAKEKGIIPQISFLGNYVGAPFVSGGTGGVDMRFNFQHNLNDGWSIGYNVGGQGAGFYESFDLLYTFVVSKAFDDKLAAFAEAYGFFVDASGNPQSLLYGLTYLLDKDMQLDVYAGNALNEWAPDFVFGLGFSIRIPGK